MNENTPDTTNGAGDCGPEYDYSDVSRYSISEGNLPILRERLDKLVKKAEKLGVTACSYSIGKSVDKPFIRRLTDAGGYRFELYTGEKLKELEDLGKITYRRYFEVLVSGPAPVLAGWEFVATLQHLSDDKGTPMNMLRVRPGFDVQLPQQFRGASCKCDHCQTIRNRKDSYVVRNVSTGTWKQVGSTCIKDFCGGNDPRAVAFLLEWDLETARLCDEDDDGTVGGCGGGEYRWSLREFLATTAAVIRTEGWLSRSKARDDEYGPRPTADLVLEALINKRA